MKLMTLAFGAAMLTATGSFAQSLGPLPDGIRPTGLSAFALNVVDMEKERAFYENAFGLKVATRVPATGEIREYLMSFTGRREDRPLLVLTKTAARQPGQDNFGRVVFGAPNAGELARRVVAAGGKTRGGAAIRDGGTNMVVDPEGNLIELYQAVPAAAPAR